MNSARVRKLTVGQQGSGSEVLSQLIKSWISDSNLTRFAIKISLIRLVSRLVATSKYHELKG
jgi:hypothetical protein